MWRPLLFSFLLFSLFIPLFSISLSDETFGEESNKLHLGLTLENQSFTLGGTVNVSASLPQKGNISFEIVDPLGRVKYLKTLETDEKGKVNLLFSVPPSWLPGSYTLSATAGNKGNVLNNTIQFEIKENLYLKPDLSLKSHDILIIYPGEELNFSKSKEVETLLLRDDKEKMLVYVRIWNTGDGMGVAKIKIFLRSGNNKHFLAEINISIEATSYEILSFEMDGTSIPEDCEYFFLFVSIEDTTPRDKNPFNNKVVKKFE
ncbi:MAG TPA: hypothetical protein EYP29_01165, partial [Thermoplasmata archaeon]|nr:hypothetical protein [Thermoplasmata archaeon]